MGYAERELAVEITPVIAESQDVRAAFIQKTYLHLAGAIGLFTLLEVIFFNTAIGEAVANFAFQTNWLIFLGGFIVVSWIARSAAHKSLTVPMQYLALFVYVLAEALLFTPLLFIAQLKAPGAIESAAYATLGGFGLLTAIAFYTKKDFSFLRGILMWAGACAIILIVLAVIFGLPLGIWFSWGMIAIAGGAILFDTSNVLHHFPHDRHVGAALELFASVALLFWYVLSIFISRD